MTEPRLVRWGGIAAITGGATWVAIGVLLPTALRASAGGTFGSGSGQDFFELLHLLRHVGSVLFAVGLAGLYLYTRLADSNERPPRPAIAGLILAGVTGVASVVAATHEATVGLIPVRPESLFSIIAGVAYSIEVSGLPLAAVLLGIAVLRSDMLVGWKLLPLSIGILDLTTLIAIGLFFPSANLTRIWSSLAYGASFMLVGLLCSLLGYYLLRSSQTPEYRS